MATPPITEPVSVMETIKPVCGSVMPSDF